MSRLTRRTAPSHGFILLGALLVVASFTGVEIDASSRPRGQGSSKVPPAPCNGPTDNAAIDLVQPCSGKLGTPLRLYVCRELRQRFTGIMLRPGPRARNLAVRLPAAGAD